MADPYLQMGEGGGDHLDSEIREGVVSKLFFGLKIKWGPGPLPWIPH